MFTTSESPFTALRGQRLRGCGTQEVRDQGVSALRCPAYCATVSCSLMSDLAPASRLSGYSVSLGRSGEEDTCVRGTLCHMCLLRNDVDRGQRGHGHAIKI